MYIYIHIFITYNDDDNVYLNKLQYCHKIYSLFRTAKKAYKNRYKYVLNTDSTELQTK
jgi:hypothetical protein